MTFFNFQPDENGQQEFQVSDRWWYFLAATVPLTCVVFTVWIVWQRIRFRKCQVENMASNYVGDDVELDAFDGNGGNNNVGPPRALKSRKTLLSSMSLLLKRRG
jgi:hypothetical protein